MGTSPSQGSSSAQPGMRVAAVVIDDEAQLDVDALARACSVGPQWVVERVEAGLLETFGPAHDRQWRFSSASLVRARRMVHLEQGFDANPELAALATDLMEEVGRLRARIRAAGLRE